MSQFTTLFPFYVIAISVVVLLLLTSFYRHHKLIVSVSVAGMLLAFVSVFNLNTDVPLWASKMLTLDNLSKFYFGITLFASILISGISYLYISKIDEQKEEYYILLNVAVLGTMVMVAGNNLASVFLGLELLSIPLYVLVAYHKKSVDTIEASIKYMLLAAASSTIFVFGMGLLYASWGTLDLKALVMTMGSEHTFPSYAIVGLALIIAAVGFKLALAPFHAWTMAVYQGSPAPTAAFIGSVAKAGILVFSLRILGTLNLVSASAIITVLTVLSAVSMVTGNFLALRQNNIKRLLAASSIAQMGYMLIAIIAGGQLGMQAATFYLSAYFVTIIGAFGVIALLEYNGTDVTNFNSIRGLYFKNKTMAVVLSAMFLSLAGMPMTAGFIAKFFMVTTGLQAHNWLLIWFLIINSAISLYYYLKVVFVIFKADPEISVYQPMYLPVLGSVIIGILFIALLWMGIAPDALFQAIIAAVK